MKIKEILIASGNIDKIKEIKELLKDLDINILTKKDVADFPEVVEDKDTISGNAQKKALEIAKRYNMITLADDTGFFVKALNGKPGVYAARYAGEHCSYEDNRKKLLDEMKDKEDRSAYFETVAVLASPNEILAQTNGRAYGKIAFFEIGEDGFGYDAIFISDDSGKTFAQMSSKEKNKISHRGKALKNMKEKIIEIIKFD